MKLKLSKSIVGETEANAVAEVILKDGYLGMGAEVYRFETDLANYLGVDPECVVCVNSGTAALHLALQALGGKGSVLVPSFTYLASYQAITAAGCVPVSCDVYEHSLTINLEDAQNKIQDDTIAIMPVHYASNPFELNKVYRFAEENNIRVVEDAAHAFGCEFQSKKIGSFGDIVCFSFDGIKNITSGEGGAIITQDQLVLNSVKDSRLLGIMKDSEKRYAGQRSWEFDVVSQGYRYHMSNIFAAIGRVQLKRLESEFAPKRIKLFELYQNLLSTNENITFNTYDSHARVIPHILPIRIKNGQRDALREKLNNAGIMTGIHYKPNHLLTFFAKKKLVLPITEKVYSEILTLPLHPELTSEDVIDICSCINSFFK